MRTTHARNMMALTAAGVVVAVLTLPLVTTARSQPSPPVAPPPSSLAALAQPTVDDARRAVAIGSNGEVYEPDGKGAWTRTQRISTSKRISHVARAGDAIVAFGEGVVYRLAPNGWSAIRLHQKDRAVLGVGPRAVAAVGRQLFALDRAAGGEPLKLALAPTNVLALGTAALPAPAAMTTATTKTTTKTTATTTTTLASGIVIQTAKGLFRVTAGRLTAVKNAPAKLDRLVGHRWALVEDGAIDLETGRKQGWPRGTVVLVAAMMADARLAMVVRQQAELALVVVAKDKLQRTAIDGAPTGAAPVGVVVDSGGRAVVAMADGMLLVRDGKWSAVRVTEALSAERPGAPPATSR